MLLHPMRRARSIAWFLVYTALVLVAGDLLLGVLLPRFAEDPFFRRDFDSIQEELKARNNVFLVSDRDYPYPRRDDELVVGIFGGSVAAGLANYLRKPEHLSALSAFSRRMGKKIRVENFTFLGGAEPVQFNLLHLFHDQIDAAVFVDGFNELFQDSIVDQRRGCGDLLPLWARHPSPMEVLEPVMSRRIALRRESSWWGWLRYSGVFRIYLYRHGAQMNLVAQRYFRSLTADGALFPEIKPSRAEKIDEWQRCTDLSASFANAERLPIYFFLQPNQYVTGSKRYTKEEQEGALYREQEVSPQLWQAYRELNGSYLEMERRLASLREKGIHAESLSGIYRDVASTIYTDRCCHVNDDGNELMAQAIFKSMLAASPAASR